MHKLIDYLFGLVKTLGFTFLLFLILDIFVHLFLGEPLDFTHFFRNAGIFVIAVGYAFKFITISHLVETKNDEEFSKLKLIFTNKKYSIVLDEPNRVIFRTKGLYRLFGKYVTVKLKETNIVISGPWALVADIKHRL